MRSSSHMLLGIAIAAIGFSCVSLLVLGVSIAVATPVLPAPGPPPQGAMSSTPMVSTVLGVIVITGLFVGFVFVALSRARRVVPMPTAPVPVALPLPTEPVTGAHEPEQLRKAA